MSESEGFNVVVERQEFLEELRERELIRLLPIENKSILSYVVTTRQQMLVLHLNPDARGQF